jgi:hypothetical protein
MANVAEHPAQPYKTPALPAYTAWAIYYASFWLIPYWISEFIILCVKERMLEDGVGPFDWIALFFWLIAEIIGNYLATRAIRCADWTITSPVWFFILLTFFRCFLTFWLFIGANTVLRFEVITGVVTVVMQILLFFGTVISVGIYSRDITIQPAEYQ